MHRARVRRDDLAVASPPVRAVLAGALRRLQVVTVSTGSVRPWERVTLGVSNEVVITRYPAVAVVVGSPDELAISLDLVATAGDPLSTLFVHNDRIYLGNDPEGNEVVYRIVGWDPEQKALRAVRQR